MTLPRCKSLLRLPPIQVTYIEFLTIRSTANIRSTDDGCRNIRNLILYNMKKAYLIRMSEDGNDRYVYTNIKALYNGIIDTGYDVKYICHIDDNNKWINISFTYANLVKDFKKYAGTHLYKEINADGYGSLEIQEISIKSK